ncbi:MAG: Eco57I restriction-modification methylase domain-containing protein [Clostridiales bacterium]|jgi:superfamily II DNA or RNA helicase|nr:Eco57I restriction-modification methylase domain-containing protein [Clostridiales bacterium]
MTTKDKFLNLDNRDNIIVGRVDPSIYAFSTQTVPNYLKVGDTYRLVRTRLNEWKQHFPELQKEFETKAKINDETYFRDYEVHKYLDGHKKERHIQDELVHNSKEFFKDTKPKDIEDAIKDIKQEFDTNSPKYSFYKFDESRIPLTHAYLRNEIYEPRPNQRQAIDNFSTAITNGKTNLLMYAVMRFGKSFTSMCCATEMNDKKGAKVVVIVSGKADVKEEWKKTVESHTRFSDYKFLDSEALFANDNEISEIITNTVTTTPNKVAIFLTLQDLQGEPIKAKHKQVFDNQIDLVIVDETHFGARAEKYGAVLLEQGAEDKESDSLEALQEQVKILKSKVKIHLSGTPYRILMGSEFEKEDIIAFCQFTDIIEEKEKWDGENLSKDNIDEWDNPYYAFPQMVRFAFNPNQSAQKLIETMKANGSTTAFSELFKPKSIEKRRDNLYKEFIHKEEVVDLLQIIDGSKQEQGMLGFLDYDKIKDGKMCRHIVFVLPYKASCNAMEKLIADNKPLFKNLQDYEIINIAGVDILKTYKNIGGIKQKIKECESQNQKTLTLTVNRMLTGSTVPEWDTMVYLKDTASPQEYDQAVFRLQNQYVKTYENETVPPQKVKCNMKPQTLLVDFCPDRMFRLQEMKSQIFNANTDIKGNDKLEERLKKELAISPIIVFNKDKIKRVDTNDILKAVQEYSKNRSVLDETKEIPVDYLLQNIESIATLIGLQEKLGSKGGLETKAHSGEETDYENPQNDNESIATNNIATPTATINEGEDDFKEKFATFYARLLFYAFLSKDRIHSLQDIIDSITPNPENNRIAVNLGIDCPLVLSTVKTHINSFVLSKLDYKIKNINDLSHDTSITPIERVQNAINKFSRLSASEVITPTDIAKDMANNLPNDLVCIINRGGKTLDIASKLGEFTLALYKRLTLENVKPDRLKNTFYSIPTSSWSYEFTRKVYEILGLNINNIAAKFNSYDLLKPKLKDKNNKIDYERIKRLLNQNKEFSKITIKDEINGEIKMKFDVIIGNPPYQDDGGSGGENDAPIYQHFAQLANGLTNAYSTLILPARWFTAGRENLLGDFRQEMINNNNLETLFVYPQSNEVFGKSVEIKGGVCYYLIDKKYEGSCDYTIVKDGIKDNHKRILKGFDIIIRDPKLASIVEKVVKANNGKGNVDTIISADTPFGISSNPKTSKKTPCTVYEASSPRHDTLLYHIENQKRKIEYVDKTAITKNAKDIDKDKVFICGTGGSGNDPHVLAKTELAPKNSVCSQSYLYSAFDTKAQAENFNKYIKTRFFRILVSAMKITQSAPKRVYKFVPLQDFSNENETLDWSKTINEIDGQLFAIYGLSEDDKNYLNQMIAEMK